MWACLRTSVVGDTAGAGVGVDCAAMKNGVSPGVDTHPHAAAEDVLGAVAQVESAITRSLDGGAGEPDAASRVRRAAERIALGERVSLTASTRDLLAARDVMAEMASRRLATVFHAVDPAGDAALSLAEVGWALLFASDIGESVDLTLVARRAAEDSGTPFIVVHDAAHVGARRSPISLDPALVASFLGPVDARVRPETDPGHPSHADVDARAFAERVPFALASALRELEGLTGRKRDVLTRSAPGQGADAALVLLGIGSLGEILLGEVARLRAEGHDVGAVKVTAFRPFPGPRAVRLLARAHAVTVVEHTDLPLAQSNALTRELKAAFADAITWAPDYPGVGRIPRIHSAVIGSGGLDARAVDAMIRNMLAGEQGKRFLTVGGGGALEGDASASRAHP
jgi:hypothetical protein